MKRLARLAKWSWRSWPVIVTALTGVVHFLLYSSLSPYWTHLNKAINVILQLAGGGLLLYSLNSNIGTFGKGHLWFIFKNYIRTFPWNVRVVNLKVSPSTQWSTSTSGAITITKSGRNFEERLQDVERKLEEYLQHQHEKEQRLIGYMDGIRAGLTALINRQETSLYRLSSRVEESFVGGMLCQFFGFLLLAYAAVMSFFI
jgi:hypothetical protein